ncbi:hypothetical protein [Nocardia phage P69]|nr:hypothetical protein [Nocardia phage P69]
MFEIRDATGRVLGSVSPTPETADTLRRVGALASRMRRNMPTEPLTPPAVPVPAEPARRVSGARRVLYGLAGVAVFGFAVGLADGDEPTAAVASPVVTAPAPVTVSPVNSPNLAGYHHVDRDGQVIMLGEVVDDVDDGGSPLRARYLAHFTAAGVAVGDQSRTVREGVQFCSDVAAGRTVAMRELFDARADAPQYGTGERRRVLATAATGEFCPKYAQ